MPIESRQRKNTKKAKWLTISLLLQVCNAIYYQQFVQKINFRIFHILNQFDIKNYLTESTKEEEEMDQFDMDI